MERGAATKLAPRSIVLIGAGPGNRENSGVGNFKRVFPVSRPGTDQSSEYFFALPRALSAGYFCSLSFIFSRAASSRFTSSLSARRTR